MKLNPRKPNQRSTLPSLISSPGAGREGPQTFLPRFLGNFFDLTNRISSYKLSNVKERKP